MLFTSANRTYHQFIFLNFRVKSRWCESLHSADRRLSNSNRNFLLDFANNSKFNFLKFIVQDFFLLKELNVLTQVTSRNEEGAIKDILFKKKSISGESFLHYDPDKVFMGDGNILPKYNIFLNGEL